MIWQIMHRPNGPNGVETLNSSWVLWFYCEFEKF